MKKLSTFIIVLAIFLGSVLRLWNISNYPQLNADEAALGYNAYSLLNTGKDEFGTFWPLVFRSFDDYKPGVYVYLTLPFVKVFGLNPLAVRLPSLILSVVSILFLYLLVIELTRNNPQQKIIAAFSSLLLAVNPWHIHFSRGAWETQSALAFTLIGLWALSRYQKNKLYLPIGMFSLTIALYTYHSMRVLVPLIGIFFIIQNYKQLIKLWKFSLLNLALGIVLLIPFTLQILSPSGISRAQGVSLWSDSGPLWRANEVRSIHAETSVLVKILHNRYSTYSYRFAKNYLSHFSPRFLFITGDEISRNKVPNMGQSYLWTAPFFLLGICFLIRVNNNSSKFILSLFFISPIAAALTFQSPHALRAQNMVYPLMIITAIGLFEFIILISRIKINLILYTFYFLLTTISGYEVMRYLHLYYVHYPKELSYAWQYGFDQIASYVSANEDKYDHIVISDRYDQPYILMAFFMKLPPEELQKATLTPRDKFGFSTVRDLGKMEFRQINYGSDKNLVNTLIISADEPVDDSKVIHTVVDPGGKVLFKFLSTRPYNIL